MTDKRLVRVTWRDASDPDEKRGWLSEDEVDAFGEEEVIVTSVGWVKSSTKHYLTLVADYIPHGDGTFTWGRATKIPQAMLVTVEDLTATT